MIISRTYEGKSHEVEEAARVDSAKRFIIDRSEAIDAKGYRSHRQTLQNNQQTVSDLLLARRFNTEYATLRDYSKRKSDFDLISS